MSCIKRIITDIRVFIKERRSESNEERITEGKEGDISERAKE